MKKIVLYGAGKRGKKYERILYNHGIEIAGFCDSFKNGSVIVEHEGKKQEIPILNLESLNKDEYLFVISVANHEQFI